MSTRPPTASTEPTGVSATCLAGALAYAARGWAVLPCWWPEPTTPTGCACYDPTYAPSLDCSKPGKHPIGRLVPHGVSDATKDQAAIAGWYRQYPRANVAIATGSPSGFDALDVDGDEGRATLADFEGRNEPLPNTPHALTGSGGLHHCFASRPGLRNAVKFAPGLDLRTTGGFIVAAPSLHVSGRRYAWEVEHDPADVAFAPWPDWLFRLATAARDAAPRGEGDSDGALIGDGARNATLTSLAGTMRHRGMGKDEIDAALQEVNRRRCKPPLTEEEVRGIAASVARYAPDHGASAPAKPVRRARRGPVRELRVAFDRGDHAEMADALLANVAEDRADLVFDEGRLHRFEADSGLWRALEPSYLRSVVKSFAGCRKGEAGTLKVKLSDATGASVLAGDVVHVPGYFSSGPDGIAFESGYLALDDDRLALLPHARDNRARTGLPFAYGADDRCPRWMTFLAECFDGTPDADARTALIQEFGGASLMGIAPRFQKALVLIGPGGSGKSVAAKVLEGIMPPGSICAIPPQTMDDEYRLALLAAKRLNVVSELPTVDIACGETVKAVITGESQTGRRIREAPFTFRPRAGHLFATNSFPSTRDHSDAFFRRFLVVSFPNGRPENEYESNLHETILDAERPAITTWLIRGCVRLLSRGRYDIPTSLRDGVAQWKDQSSNVLTFLSERTRASRPAESGTIGSRLYEEYCGWARASRRAALGVQRFSQELAAAGRPRRHTEHGSTYPVELLDDAAERDAIQSEGRSP